MWPPVLLLYIYIYLPFQHSTLSCPLLIAALRCVLVSQSKVMVPGPRSRMRRQTPNAVGKLRLVWVVLSGINFEPGLDVLVPLVGPSHHPQDGLLQDLLRLPLQHVRRLPLLQSAGVASVPPVELVCQRATKGRWKGNTTSVRRHMIKHTHMCTE